MVHEDRRGPFRRLDSSPGMPFDSRALRLVLALGLVGAPAALLRALCVGQSCQVPDQTPRRIPFCSLPAETRSLTAAGFREERSPDVLAVTGSTRVRGGSGFRGSAPPWPSVDARSAGRVPVVFWGAGVDPSAEVPARTELRDVAPTLASVLRFQVPHPEVRSGQAIEGVASGTAPRLVVMVVWKGVGSADLEESRGRWPELDRLLATGAGTLEGNVGSLPLDPAAAVATLGTGALPAEHGITGTLLRNGDRVVQAWGQGAPVSIVATLADDLDERLRQRPRIGVVGTRATDRGAIGGNWYLRGDRDDVVIEAGPPEERAAAAADLLRRGYGADGVPDLLLVALEGPIARMDAALARVVRAAREAAEGSVSIVVTATGSVGSPSRSDVAAAALRDDVEQALAGPAAVIEGVALGGLFLDQRGLVNTDVTAEDVIRELRTLPAPRGGRLLADTFPGIAVTLARYC